MEYDINASKNLIEKVMFPWCRDEGLAGQSKSVKKRVEVFMKRYGSSLKERASIYFQTPPEDYMARGNLTIPEVEEYEICEVMWKKFGIRPWELECLDANWVIEMITMISENNKAETERMNRLSQ